MASGTWTVTRHVVQFTAAGAVALAVVAFATATASARAGQREATSDARTTASVKAQSLVEPVLLDSLTAGDPAAVAAVDAVVRARVLDANLIRVKIWNREGTIVYSDEPRLLGVDYVLGADELAAIDAGVVEAEVSDLTRPENAYEREQGKLLEVYLPVRTPDGGRLLFEAYFRYEAVSAAGKHLWRSFAPTSLGALVALQLVQIPLAWSLARRLRDRQQEREELLQRSIEASELERRRIAGDLHDGVVQDLAGVAFSLSASARQPGLSLETTGLLETSATAVRASIKSLRTLLVDIYPPSLADAGLEDALTDLLAATASRGLRAGCDTSELDPAPTGETAGLIYRAAQEALRNVVAHAGATSVHLSAAVSGGRVVLDVIDDGVGYDADLARLRAREGHLGLRGLADRVAAAGGAFVIKAQEGGGTHLHVEVPL